MGDEIAAGLSVKEEGAFVLVRGVRTTFEPPLSTKVGKSVDAVGLAVSALGVRTTVEPLLASNVGTPVEMKLGDAAGEVGSEGGGVFRSAGPDSLNEGKLEGAVVTLGGAS